MKKLKLLLQKNKEFPSQNMVLKSFIRCQNSVLFSSFCVAYCIAGNGGEYIKKVFLESSSLYLMILMATLWLKKELMCF